jgi:hypothetical protein
MRRASWPVWGLRVPLVLMALAFAFTGLSRAAGTDAPVLPDQFDPYLHRITGALADPINLVFLNADPDSVAASIHRVLGWPLVAGSPMVFSDQGAQNPTGWQLGLDLGRGSRIHLRVEALPADSNQSYVLAAVHRDEGVACGHIGGAFDRERQLVARAFAAAGYAVTAEARGNTQAAPQCDGSFTSGDGTIVFIDLATRIRTPPNAQPPVFGPADS